MWEAHVLNVESIGTGGVILSRKTAIVCYIFVSLILDIGEAIRRMVGASEFKKKKHYNHQYF